MSSSIVKMSEARKALAEAKSLDDIMQIRDIAEAARSYARVARLGLESQNEAAEIKIRAERKAGELLREMPKAQGSDYGGRTDLDGNRELPSNPPPTYADIGVEKMQAHRWQTIATLPEEDFEEFINDTLSADKELTSAGVIRESHRILAKQDKITPVAMAGKYRVLYADPPWKYGNTMPDYYYGPDDHYPLLSLKEICELPVAEIAEQDSVLFLWTTSPMLEESFDVIKAWGFKYKTSFIWDKVKHNMGHYNSVRHELLLVCVRGSYQPNIKKLFDSVHTEERTGHSVKPEYFRNVIDTIYPEGNRIELFARVKVDNWEVWGNELS